MLARSSKIVHPNGFELKTPLLVKSFSSKGFKYAISPKNIKSEVAYILEKTSEVLTDSILLSAYDLKYYLPEPKKLVKEINPEFLFIDSGGYETIESYDLSEVYQYPVLKREDHKWDREEHTQILNSVSDLFSSIIISYDNGNERKTKIKHQIAKAKKLFEAYPNALHDYLIKASTPDGIVDINEVRDCISLMHGFHFIGLTEKELGTTIIDRMHKISIIRKHLDSVGNSAPLHIFGCLDPLTSVLYFLAGAEVFDGLTWLRFSFYNGLCVYRDNYNILKERATENDSNNYYMSHIDNVTYLRNLQGQMRSFLKEPLEKSLEERLKTFKFNSEFITSCMAQFNSL